MMNQPRGSINKKNIIKKAVLLSMGGALLMSISSGAEEVYSLPEMVVTAEKMPVESKKEPQAVQVVDQKEIESLGAVNATQALELVTGINLSSGKAGSTASMGGTQVMLRGMNTNQVLILVDGRRMADEDTSQTKNAYLVPYKCSQIGRSYLLHLFFRMIREAVGLSKAHLGADAFYCHRREVRQPTPCCMRPSKQVVPFIERHTCNKLGWDR